MDPSIGSIDDIILTNCLMDSRIGAPHFLRLLCQMVGEQMNTHLIYLIQTNADCYDDLSQAMSYLSSRRATVRSNLVDDRLETRVWIEAGE